MKLWVKITLVCTAVLTLIVSVCCTLLFIYSRDRILAVTTESTVTQQENLASSFTQMVSYYGSEDTGPVAMRSLVLYCFQRFASDTAVLQDDDETLYSNVGFNPAALFPSLENGQQQTYIGVIHGRNVLIAASQEPLLSQNYTVFIIRDITEIYRSLSLMLRNFIFIGTIGIAIGTLLVVLFVRYFTKPLKSLELSSRRIAQGEYAERVLIPTKDEIAELAQDFNKMAQAVQTNYQELKEMTERQQLFIGSLTHEFKTPLTSLIGHSETLLCTDMPKDVIDNSLLHIHEQCRWLERLTQKMLKLIDLQETVDLKEASVPNLLEALQDYMGESLRKRGLSLNVKCTVETLRMDSDLMLSLLINLVDNAAKASSEGQAIEIKAYENCLEVVDCGIGIPQEELQRITEPFYRVDKSRSKKMGGSGLGLALVKRISDVHGASLLFYSVLGQGTRVKILFHDNKSFTS